MKLKLPAVFGLLVLAAAVSVDATTVPRLANEEMTNTADLIVIGKAIESHVQWIDRALYTMVTVEVSETLKGEPARQIQIALPGGIDSNRKFPVAMTYAGAPTFALQEQAFLFLESGEDMGGAYAIVGFSQGKYSIVTDNAGVKRVSRDLTPVQVQDANGVTRGTRTFEPLADFVDEIRGHLQSGQ